jgi:basic membrane protein A
MFKITRKAIGVLAASAVVLGASACASGASAESGGEPGSAEAPLKVAVVLGGLANDGGFNQYIVDPVRLLEEEGAIEAQIRESVTTAAEAEPIFRQYAAEDFDLVIGWGLGLSDPIFTVAAEEPETDFIASGAADILERTTDNVETWTYDFAQFGYLTGWVAGQAKLSPYGIVDAVLAPYNEPAYEALRIAIQETNPGAVELEPIFTGDSSDSQLANQATRTQIDRGAQLIVTAAYENNQGIISAVKEGGIAVIGASNLASADAAEVNLGIVKIDWTPTLREIVQRLQDGSFGNQGYNLGIANKGLVLGDINFPASAPEFPADIEAQIAELADRLASGEITLDISNG